VAEVEDDVEQMGGSHFSRSRFSRSRFSRSHFCFLCVTFACTADGASPPAAADLSFYMPGDADVADQELLARFQKQLDDKLVGLDLCKRACPNDRWVLLQRCCCCSCFCYFRCAVLHVLSLMLIPPLRRDFYVGAKVKETTGCDMPLQKIHHVLYATVPNAWFFHECGSGPPSEPGRRKQPMKQETAQFWADELALHGLEITAEQLVEFISAFDLLPPLEKLWWEGLHWASLGKERPQVARIVFWVRFCFPFA
jgi:hypothetical protein